MTAKTRALLLVIIGLAAIGVLIGLDIADGFTINDVAIPILVILAVVVPNVKSYISSCK